MRSERGSALLIVFVFAAIIAIMLYRALPDAMFEGQRQKEQLLIDRGTEYKTAIKRFLVRNKTYPTSLDQLDNFNNLRYIRHRFKDPMSGKQEWRIIHVMNPGFILTDSKVKPLNQNQVNSAGGFGANTNSQGGFGSIGNGDFGSNNTSASGNPNANTSSFGSSSTGSNTGDSSTTQQSAADPNAPPAATAAQLYGAQRRPAPVSAANLPGGEQPAASDQLADKPLPEPAPAAVPNGQLAAANTSGNNPQPNSGAPSATPDANNPTPGGIDAVNSSLRRQGPTPTPAFGASPTSQRSGITAGAGAIAGVASTAKGSTIKIVDGQTDYSKWEFVYNPQNDAASKMQSALGNNNKNPNGTNTQNTGGFGNNPNQQNPSGSSFGSVSSFGSSSGSGFGGSSFGSPSSSGGFGAPSSAPPPTQSAPVSQ